MTRSTLLGLAWTALLPPLAGCATQSDNQTKQLNELGDQVRRLQATTDRLQERLSALENLRTRENERAARQVPNAQPSVPDLPVVKMTPETRSPNPEASAPASDSDEPRPLIVGEGSRIETRTSGGESMAPSGSPRRSKEKSGDASSKRPNPSTEAGKK